MAQRKFAVFDIDGTVIRWQLYHAIVSNLAARELLPAGAAEAIDTARMTWKKRAHKESFKAYEQTLITTYHDALTTVPVAQFNQAVNQVFDEHKDQVYTYTRNLIQQLKTDGYMLLAISGSQTEILARLADYYGFDDLVGTAYVQVAGRFTGESTTPVGHKGEVLHELITKHDLTLVGSIAVGDSKSDAEMLQIVERPIAFNPDAALLEIAQANHSRNTNSACKNHHRTKKCSVRIGGP